MDTMLAPLIAVALLAQQTPVGKGVNFYSREKEEALGAQLAAEVRRSARVFEDPAALVYVERLAQSIAAHLPVWPAFRFEFIADDGGPLQLPVVLPGGYIFIRAGLFKSAANEAEFAAMLAHSMAHSAARHGTRQATRGQMINHTSAPVIFMGGWSGIHGESTSQAVPLGFLTFQRAFELEADRIAVGALARAGYDPSTLARYIERLQQDPPSKIFSGQPPREERLAVLRSAIAPLPPREYTANTGEFERVRDALNVPPLPKPQREPPTLRRP
jgi:predicted Zn-dependent protease